MITIATYWKSQDAELARMNLEAAGIDVFMADALTVQADYLLTSSVGGIKIQVVEEDEAAAREVLHQSAIENQEAASDDPRIADPRFCPVCELREAKEERPGWLVYLAIPFTFGLSWLLWSSKRVRCPNCGHTWYPSDFQPAKSA